MTSVPSPNGSGRPIRPGHPPGVALEPSSSGARADDSSRGLESCTCRSCQLSKFVKGTTSDFDERWRYDYQLQGWVRSVGDLQAGSSVVGAGVVAMAGDRQRMAVSSLPSATGGGGSLLSLGTGHCCYRSSEQGLEVCICGRTILPRASSVGRFGGGRFK